MPYITVKCELTIVNAWILSSKSSQVAMTSKFRIRFAGKSKQSFSTADSTCQPPKVLDLHNQRRKSLYGCVECKRRHLKCDEAFPVCSRCRRSKVPCRPVWRSTQWQLEMPGLTMAGSVFKSLANVNHRLLQYWLEKASQVMVVDPEINPLSFDILGLLQSSPALVHSIQSISAGHKDFYSSSSAVNSLEERDHALSLVQKELQESDQAALRGSLLAVLLLGLSTSWVYNETGHETGLEHLYGARAILDVLLAKPGATQDPIVRTSVAITLFFDQATAYLPQFGFQTPCNNERIWECVQSMRNDYNAIVGYSIEVMYLMADVGRYCRNVMDGMTRALDLEASWESQLLTAWDPPGTDPLSALVSSSFRRHGLIMLYRTIQSNPLSEIEWFAHEDAIIQYALDILHDFEAVPEASQYRNILAQPLFTAGAEVSSTLLREQVAAHFRQLFSTTRVPAQLDAINLLNELWSLDDEGCKTFWMGHLTCDKVFILC